MPVVDPTNCTLYSSRFRTDNNWSSVEAIMRYTPNESDPQK